MHRGSRAVRSSSLGPPRGACTLLLEDNYTGGAADELDAGDASSARGDGAGPILDGDAPTEASLTEHPNANARKRAFVAVGDKGRTGTSPDGVSWQFKPESSSPLFTHVTHGQGLFVTNDGRTSKDGLSWTVPARPDGPVTYGGGVFLHFNSSDQSIYRSTDGTS